MNDIDSGKVESVYLSDFTRIMERETASPHHLSAMEPVGSASNSSRMNLDEENVKNGLGGLVLTLVKLLHELLERQAIRRIDAGNLRDDEIERLGHTLMKQAQEIDRLRKVFNLDEEDLNLDLGPLGKLL